MPLPPEDKAEVAERLARGEDVEIKTSGIAPADVEQGVDLSVDSKDVIDALLAHNAQLTLELAVARLQIAKLT